MVNFYNIILERLNYLLEEASQQYLQFVYKVPKVKNIAVSIISDFTKDEIKEIRNLRSTKVADTSQSHLIRPKKDTDIVDKKLYKISYLTGGINKDTRKFEERQLFAFCYFTNEDYNKATAGVKKVNSINPPKEYIKIDPIEFEDLIKLIKNEKLGDNYKRQLIAVFGEDFNNIIGASSKYATAQREYEKNKGRAKVPKEVEDSETTKAIKKAEEIYGVIDDKIIKAANSFFYNPKYSKLLEDIVEAHKRTKLETISGEEKIKAIDNRDTKIYSLVNKINSVTIEDLVQDTDKKVENLSLDKVKDAIIKYVIYVKIQSEHPKDAKLYDKIYAVYTKSGGNPIERVKSIDKEETEDKKQSNKKKQTANIKKPTNEKGTREYVLTYYHMVGGRGKEYDKVESLTPKAAIKAEKEAIANKNEYDKLKKAYDDWDMSTDPNKMKEVPDLGILKVKDAILLGIRPKKAISEMSSTGGGAAPGEGAGVTPGEGEGVATKYAFGGAGRTKAKVKSSIINTKKAKNIKSENYSDLKNDAKMIFLETVRGYLSNK